ncbi:helix-turn-helix domain-containing protein [Actinokineospora cianjurensis]|uniref:Transcriptional regulator with XRE-family HTH domain n=1 Tax=Actinokineospora cianjurensis TaxID=585224 RepID=A0A421AZC3_9PSEU|nr:helix-turn-helix transcriptional regulator [Actinokineospora cianjurensis]RLK55160.1 transcriptional regulator with XRE-family HTH domain [Actinokineospora cianjurensis]
MADSFEVGARVRYWRDRRQLDRKQFADLVGRSTSWLDKVESGERALERLPLIERVAEVLGIEPSVLTDRRAADRAQQCVDPTEVAAIRAALGQYVDDDRPVDLAAVTRQATYLDHAWLSSRFTVVARHLPSLMADARRAVVATPDQLSAHRVKVSTYRLASSVLLKFDSTDLAWLAADRAMHAAQGVDDPWSLARATRSVARAMGRTQQAVAVLTGVADRVREQVAADEADLLAVYGMLFLAASITAADLGDAGFAGEMHEQASAVAGRFEPHFADHQTCFGVANVRVHRVAALVRLGQPGKAIETARTIDPAGLTPERKANLLLDLTEAHIAVAEHHRAAYVLAQAERVAPEEVRCRPVAHGLVRTLLRHTTGAPAGLVAGIAERAGVAA